MFASLYCIPFTELHTLVTLFHTLSQTTCSSQPDLMSDCAIYSTDRSTSQLWASCTGMQAWRFGCCRTRLQRAVTWKNWRSEQCLLSVPRTDDSTQRSCKAPERVPDECPFTWRGNPKSCFIASKYFGTICHQLGQLDSWWDARAANEYVWKVSLMLVMLLYLHLCREKPGHWSLQVMQRCPLSNSCAGFSLES